MYVVSGVANCEYVARTVKSGTCIVPCGATGTTKRFYASRSLRPRTSCLPVANVMFEEQFLSIGHLPICVCQSLHPIVSSDCKRVLSKRHSSPALSAVDVSALLSGTAVGCSNR